MNLLLTALKIVAEYYPGRLHKAFVIDPPSLFSYLWKVKNSNYAWIFVLHAACCTLLSNSVETPYMALAFYCLFYFLQWAMKLESNRNSSRLFELCRYILNLVVAGRSTVPGVISGDDGGCFAGLWGVSGVQRLLIVSASLVAPVWPLFDTVDGEDRVMLILTIFIHSFPPLRLFETLVPLIGRHVRFESWAHQPLTFYAGTGPDFPTQRQITLLRISCCQDATRRHLRRQRQQAGQEKPICFDSTAGANQLRQKRRHEHQPSEDPKAILPPITRTVLQEGVPRQQGRQVSWIVSPLFEVLQEAVRRDDLQVEDEAPTWWPHFHRLSSAQTPPHVSISAVLKERWLEKRKEKYILN